MGIDLTTLLAGLTGGAQGLGVAVTQDEAKKRQKALDAEQTKLHDAQLANLADEQKGRDLARYQQGFRTGTAPDVSGILSAMQVGSAMTPGVGAAPSAAVLAMKDAASDPRFSADRFQQVTPDTYVDRTETPEAVATRQMVLKDRLTPKPPVPGSPEWRDMKIAEAKIGAEYGYHPPQQDHYTSTPSVDPTTGRPIILNTRTGESFVGQGQKPASQTHNAELAKEQKRVELMDQGYRSMEQYGDKVRPNAIAIAISHPNAGNVVLTKEEQLYMIGLRNFIAGEMHAESGARLSKEQLAFGFQRYGPQFGDKNVMRAKLAEAKRALEGSQRAFQNPSAAPDVRNDAPQPVTVDPILDKYGLTPKGH